MNTSPLQVNLKLGGTELTSLKQSHWPVSQLQKFHQKRQGHVKHLEMAGFKY